MTNIIPKTEHLLPTQWKKGQSGNPNGRPKGTKNISTIIQEMLNDENAVYILNNARTFNGKPVEAIVGVMITKALNGDMRAFELLAKYGFGRPELINLEAELPTPIMPILDQLVVVKDKA